MIEPLEKVYKVSELTDLIRRTLESDFFNLKIEGEISNFRPSSTGHYYFTLKDKNAVISAVMFKNRLGSLNFFPKDGQLVIAKGNLSVYAKRGSYQIICESMEKAGEGDILAMLEKRKRRLAAEGLFDTSRKKPLPLFPSKITVITSPTGAALRDILRVIGRRNAGIDIVILPAPVQGEDAADKITHQIQLANRYKMGEVLIIGRGGGSLEDLLPFSDENLVRAVADSELPVISAVGHEIDTSLSDLSADICAPTPSAAAEIVSASRENLLTKVSEIEASISNNVHQQIDRINILLKQFTPKELEHNFRIQVQPLLLRLDDAKEEAIHNLQEKITEKKHKLELLKNQLYANSPQEILKKGYSIVTDTETGKLLTAAVQTVPGQNISVRFASDMLNAEVKEISR